MSSSRFPVGSSARSSAGLRTMARASAARWASPWESCEGYAWARAERPTARNASKTRPVISRRASPSTRSTNAMFSNTVRPGGASHPGRRPRSSAAAGHLRAAEAAAPTGPGPRFPPRWARRRDRAGAGGSSCRTAGTGQNHELATWSMRNDTSVRAGRSTGPTAIDLAHVAQLDHSGALDYSRPDPGSRESFSWHELVHQPRVRLAAASPS